VAVVDHEGADPPPPPARAGVGAGKAPSPRVDAAEPQPEWVSGLATSAGRWTVRLLALFAGLAFWHYASVTSLNFYIRFDNVPGPLQVAQALLGHLEQSAFYLHVAASLRRIAEVLIRAAQSLGASRVCIFRHVVLPGALPSICAGLAIGMGVSWFSLLAGEIISGQYGIGYFTWNAYSIINYPDIVVGMLIIGLLGTSSTALVHLITRPALAWQPKAR
jgi:ABC-type nitrate/sulfonate/bicarbonate transport system permease component